MKKQAENYLQLTGLTHALVINFPQSDNATECEVALSISLNIHHDEATANLCGQHGPWGPSDF